MSWRTLLSLADSPVGVGAATSMRLRLAAFTIGASAVGADLWLVHDKTHLLSLRGWPFGLVIPIVAGGLLLALARGDTTRLGLRVRPTQGWWFWSKATLLAGAGVFLLLVADVIVMYAAGATEFGGMSFSMAVGLLRQACVDAPVFEEGVYRLCLCVGLVGLVGRWPTVAVGGAVFGLLHVMYGNPGPDNFLAGYLLGWAYFKSGTIVVPIVMHSLGNLSIFAAQVMLFEFAPLSEYPLS